MEGSSKSGAHGCRVADLAGVGSTAADLLRLRSATAERFVFLSSQDYAVGEGSSDDR
jgi:hypothetical protein